MINKPLLEPSAKRTMRTKRKTRIVDASCTWSFRGLANSTAGRSSTNITKKNSAEWGSPAPCRWRRRSPHLTSWQSPRSSPINSNGPGVLDWKKKTRAKNIKDVWIIGDQLSSSIFWSLCWSIWTAPRTGWFRNSSVKKSLWDKCFLVKFRGTHSASKKTSRKWRPINYII